MGLFDNIKSRLSNGGDEYAEDDQYYDDENQEEYFDEGYSEDDYTEPHDDWSSGRSASDGASGNSSRRSTMFDDFAPLVSMSDVRSQELPEFNPRSSAGTTTGARHSRQNTSEIKTSLPYVGDPKDLLEPREQDAANYTTGSLRTIKQRDLQAPAAEDFEDPLLKRHSLHNTGDFGVTSPSYYASRSGSGHVRPAGQPRRSQKYREAIVISPESYAEAEQVASHLRKGNAVILVLSNTRPELAKRILDFSFGAAAVAEGQVTCIGERIYALTSEYALTNSEIELLQARGVL